MTTPDRDYRFPPEPFPADWDREIADAIFGSIGSRLRALEAKRNELQDLIDDLSFNGQARIDGAITPLVAAVQADLEDLDIRVAETLAANQRIIEDFRNLTAVNLEELETKLVAVEDRMSVILANGLEAANVRESPTRVFVSPSQRLRINEVTADIASARRFAAAYTMAFGGR